MGQGTLERGHSILKNPGHSGQPNLAVFTGRILIETRAGVWLEPNERCESSSFWKPQVGV